MPQLSLLKQSPICRLTLTYDVDPLDPLGATYLRADVVRHDGTVVVRAGAKVEGAHLDEWVADLLEAAWLTYLYGEPDQLPSVWAPICKRWRKFTRRNERFGA